MSTGGGDQMLVQRTIERKARPKSRTSRDTRAHEKRGMHRRVDPRPEKRRKRDQGAETGLPGLLGPQGPSLPVGVRDQSAEADRRDRIETSATDQEGTGQGAEGERGQPAV